MHHGRLLQFRGESYRVRHALMSERRDAQKGGSDHVTGVLKNR